MSAVLRGDGTLRHARGLLRLAAAALCATAVVSLGGCGSISEKMSESMSSMPVVGLPAGAPERPSEVRAYPAVHDMPPPRTTATLDGSQQSEIEKELVAARERQKVAATPPPEPTAPELASPKPATTARKKPAPQRTPAPVPNVVPASSSRMIY